MMLTLRGGRWWTALARRYPGARVLTTATWGEGMGSTNRAAGQLLSILLLLRLIFTRVCAGCAGLQVLGLEIEAAIAMGAVHQGHLPSSVRLDVFAHADHLPIQLRLPLQSAHHCIHTRGELPLHGHGLSAWPLVRRLLRRVPMLAQLPRGRRSGNALLKALPQRRHLCTYLSLKRTALQHLFLELGSLNLSRLAASSPHCLHILPQLCT
mmetsp:Transcript_58177/g.138513  ORF Transcript_58177/g.138513 Transcript_58177/m.138513 type:complete len:210 (-) Transcript_58177:955-1584(-)